MWLSALVIGCAVTPANREKKAVAVVERMSDPIEVLLTPPAIRKTFRWEAETVARVLRTLEAHLHASPGVVVRVADAPAPPSVQRVPSTESGPWGVSLSVAGSTGSADIRTLTCAPRGGCEEQSVYTDTEAPERAASKLAAAVMEAVGIPVPEAPLPCLVGPPSDDSYHSLIAGRGAAVLYDLIEPTVPGDRSDDPLERAVYLDPDMALAQWVAGRGRLERGDVEQAAYSLGLAHELCPDHQGFAADLARVELDRGKKRAAASLVDGLGFPDDPRLVPLRLDTWITMGRLDDAGKLALRADRTFPKDPRVAEVMAELALAEQRMDDYETWLIRWTDRAEDDPEPVRRLVRLYAEGQRWDDAWRRLPALELRGAVQEARSWRITAGLALARYDEAAAAASDRVAERIRARATLEGAAGHQLDLAGDHSPEAHLARGTSLYQRGAPAEALAEADAALRLRPWWPEALALRADALDALGDRRRAAVARQQWRAAEPLEVR